MKNDKVAILDYMTISDRFNRNSAFFNFIDLITNYLIESGMIYSYFLTEILYEPDGTGPDQDSTLWVKLLRVQGFRSIHALYFQPPFGSDRPESKRKGHLMVLLRERSSQMSKEVYLKLVELVYKLHYKRWYEGLETNARTYEKILEALRQEIDRALAAQDVLVVNGDKEILPATRLHNSLMISEARNFTTYSVATVITISASVVALSFVSGSSLVATLSVLVISLIMYLAIVSIFVPEAGRVSERLMGFFKSVFGPKL